MSDLHKKHRERVREEFLEQGFTDNTPPHKMLELLLFYSIPRVDTNAIAHNLLNEFGSLSGVLEAEVCELMRVEGIGEKSAILIKLILPLLRQYQNDKNKIKLKFSNLDQACKYLIYRYFGFKTEVFSVISFNSEGDMLAFDKISEGNITSVGVPIRDLIQVLLKRGAASVIIAHNHLSGNALPSKADAEMTKSLKITLAQVGIKLLDHVIVSGDDAISMLQSENYKDIFS